ncbi:PaaI family thioesterase [Halomarina litorea]|uniref:PaaI family thioesterase n=1 Tax=Halomarina litorea TaxID=2961595 RepID=UPI0020C38890|nr:hypothetical protein [Halomarina sp. BCD28]
MDIVDRFSEAIPFADHLDIELDEVGDGRAVGHVDLREEHSSNPASMVAHGEVAYSLADTVGVHESGSLVR